MSEQDTPFDIVGIVGAGAMGRGIAQIAAQAGVTVRLYDANQTAVEQARAALAETLGKLASKGKIRESERDAALARIHGCVAVEALADCSLVIEAIVEKLEVKRAVFGQLEAVVADDAVLVSNTSSLSITAIGAGCRRPERVAGLHFFNPVPLMKVVEVIDGAHTAPEVATRLAAFARQIGHTPVKAKDMPGFIVNHAGRGMNTEGLRIAQEGVASFADIDRIVREQAGFRLGPFELMDLTALDVSHPVMESIYHQFYEEPRFRPSPITAQRLAGGLLGRKTQAGFYRYVDGKPQIDAERPAPAALPARVWISRADPAARARIAVRVAEAGVPLDEGEAPAADSLVLVAPLGLDATTVALFEDLDAQRVVAVDTLFPLDPGLRMTLMTTPATSVAMRDAAHALFAKAGHPVTVIEDSAGFVAQRVVATIVNIGCDIAQQKIATPEDIDLATTLGLGYPKGPLALGDFLGPARILMILRNIQQVTGDWRYRPSPWLHRRAALRLSLKHVAA
ncbi:3-hydroxyacyl-CoA dehydrogenase [Chitinasiproducens palmae]|uniref:3-hydroxyacyl-CoA dehydrogenase n=1 Tax=Chitinasiproducens palmae TaxID=1770053 RepID=A0A1H2PSI2_9BURK|nr:3-hydroxyacyl-CoA dehydrogenase [Chitinasiproducens palmae]SDV49988.1 3-hydroxyacyl-CoA dehydrogenase [Chitinasiproducens palmae]